jgi:glycyl-tRNA synthetase beta chain
MAEVLLEIGTEEIPARFMPGLLADLEQTALQTLKAERIPLDQLVVYGTDRRLVLFLTGVHSQQQNLEEELKGPPITVPEQARFGFCKKNEIDPASLTQKDGYWVGTKKVAGRPTKEILPSLFKSMITGLHLPIAMRWGEEEFQFIRPIHWIVSLWDQEILPFTLAGIASDRFSRGHRLLRAFGRISGDKGVEIASPKDYLSLMEENFVMVDHRRRKDKIRDGLLHHPEIRQGKTLIDEALLDEVTFLNEWPVVLVDMFDEAYLKLPKEILITTMQKNQKYFPLLNSHGGLLTGFMLVTNNNTNEKNVLEGNKRVLTARLEDAKFFYEEDLKVLLKDRTERLKSIVYHAKVGTLHEKMTRVEALAEWIGSRVMENTMNETSVGEGLVPALGELNTAVWLCKADLVTHVVIEFPELQGTMGRIYAQHEVYPAEVSEAIFEHYLPRFSGDQLPSTLTGALIAVADKLDSLCACFSAGLIPSGSQDPYALRRAAMGVVTILLARGWEIPLDEMLGSRLQDAKISAQVLGFLKQRLKHILQEDQHLDYDLVDAVLSLNEFNKATALATLYQSRRKDPDFIKLTQSAIRVARLAPVGAGSSTCPGVVAVPPNVHPELFQESIEHVFWDLYKNTAAEVEQLVPQKAYDRILASLMESVPTIEEYFIKVMVMDKDEKIRENRLAALACWKQLFWNYGDWEKIVQVGTIGYDMKVGDGING